MLPRLRQSSEWAITVATLSYTRLILQSVIHLNSQKFTEWRDARHQFIHRNNGVGMPLEETNQESLKGSPHLTRSSQATS